MNHKQLHLDRYTVNVGSSIYVYLENNKRRNAWSIFKEIGKQNVMMIKLLNIIFITTTVVLDKYKIKPNFEKDSDYFKLNIETTKHQTSLQRGAIPSKVGSLQTTDI